MADNESFFDESVVEKIKNTPEGGRIWDIVDEAMEPYAHCSDTEKAALYENLSAKLGFYGFHFAPTTGQTFEQ